jgi:hypothetical protein
MVDAAFGRADFLNLGGAHFVGASISGYCPYVQVLLTRLASSIESLVFQSRLGE